MIERVYLISQKPKTIIAINSRANWLKYLSIKFLICAPHILMAPAKRKKRAPRDIKEKTINGIRGNLQNPAERVTALYGRGVKPAINTAQFS